MVSTTLYNRQFFQVFGGGALFMAGVALQFHFGQYIGYLGYGVDDLGRLLAISMLGAILARLHIGQWIDRFGCRRVWLTGTALVAACVAAVQFVHSFWWICALRAVATVCTAAVMTTVAVFAARIAPPERRAESIGVIGLSGFLGMMIGPTAGDWIFRAHTDSMVPYHIFFTTAAVFSGLAGLLMCGLSGEALGPPPRVASAGHGQLQVIRRHWPGVILLVGVVFGMSFSLPGQFLERLAEARGFKDIKGFFLVYAPTAITLRVLFRRAPQVVGRVTAVVGGLMAMALGQLVLTAAHTEWGLVVPGLLMGAGHCFAFPSMVDLGAERLPAEFRGTGTALILGAGDVGMLLGYWILGDLIDACGYTFTLRVLAATVATVAVAYGVSRRGRWT